MKWLKKQNASEYSLMKIYKADCALVWNISIAERCHWVQKTENCYDESIIDYASLLFCTFGSENLIYFSLGVILLFLWIFYLFLILGTTADIFFCPSLATIASVLRLSENIAGVTILAFGNGAPDIFTSLVANEHEQLMMFTELIGAGVFVTAVIAGAVIVFAPCTLVPKYFIRDASFYILSVCWIAFIVSDKVVHLWEALGCILIYISFIAVIVVMQKIEDKEALRRSRMQEAAVVEVEAMRVFGESRQEELTGQLTRRSRAFDFQAKLDVAIERERERQQSSTSRIGLPESPNESVRPKGLFREFFYDTSPVNCEEWRDGSIPVKVLLVLRAPLMFLLQLFVPVVNETSEKRGWSKLLNCLQIIFTPLLGMYILEVENVKFGPVPLWPVCFACTFAIALLVFGQTSVNRIPKYHNALAFVGFLSAMLVVYAVAQEVMAVLQCLGYASGISDAMLGITLLAWGNSVGDFISNVTIARKGFPRMGFSACFGGPMFNTLIGLGLTYGIAAGKADGLRTRVRTSRMGPGILAFLIISLLTSMVYLSVTRFNAPRSYGYLLFFVYGIFILISILIEINYIPPPDASFDA